jgi:hypothetical protein
VRLEAKRYSIPQNPMPSVVQKTARLTDISGQQVVHASDSVDVAQAENTKTLQILVAPSRHVGRECGSGTWRGLCRGHHVRGHSHALEHSLRPGCDLSHPIPQPVRLKRRTVSEWSDSRFLFGINSLSRRVADHLH